jgi:3-methylcrotonyl-CoA carboxylase alpha subunit
MGFAEGSSVPPYYDAMIGKLIQHRPSRAEAFEALADSLRCGEIAGVKSNLGFLARLAADPAVLEGKVDTGLIERNMPAMGTPPEPSATDIARAVVAAAGLFKPGARSLGGTPPTDPWTMLQGFALGGRRADVVVLEHGGAAIEATVEPDGNDAIVVLPSGLLRLPMPVGRHGANGVHVGRNSVTVFRDGFALPFTIPDLFAERVQGGDRASAITAPMPGLVKAVHAKVGDRVEKGRPLVVLEAMKMEHAIAAPHDGVIAEITVEGRQLAHGAILVRFESLPQ